MSKLVALDAGHSKYTPGKRTPDDEREWSFNNKVLLAAKKRLEEYDDVKVLRLDDPSGQTDIPLITRTNKANAADADVLVSIHHNANTGRWGDWGGVETYVYTPLSANPKSHALAKEVHPRILKAMGLRDRGIQGKDLHMVRESDMPAILTEGGFMDSKTDIKAMRSDEKLKAQGVAIADGVADYLGLKLKKKEVAAPKPVVKPKPAAEVAGSDDHVHRVIVDGKQVGAYGKAASVAAEVEKAVKKGAKKIEIERT